MNWETEKDNIVNKYKDQFNKYGVSSNSLFFPGRKQNVRFNVIKEIGISSADSILDVGCGFADLLTFLKKTIDYKGHYTGVDITPPFIDVCKKNQPGHDFRVGDILENTFTGKWDYVVLSGTVNISIGTTHFDFVKRMVTKMFECSNKAISIDFVSIHGDNRNEYIYRADPSEIYNFCKTLTKRVCIRNDYMPYEFAVYLFKDDNISDDNIFSGYSFPEIIKY